LSGISRDAEWPEADGLGGFVSKTVGGIRTRRYHAVLLSTTTPPAGRVLLVNGFGAWVETSAGASALAPRHGQRPLPPQAQAAALRAGLPRAASEERRVPLRCPSQRRQRLLAPLALRLRFPIEMRLSCGSLVSASPERPSEDVCRFEAPVQTPIFGANRNDKV
jgi:Glycogen debranching enzyme N terminal